MIGLSPITILCGFFCLVTFGWILLNDILSPTFLQLPVDQGGYGFNPTQNAAFSFCAWFGIAGAQILGMILNDRFPLWICKRFHNGIWKPEFRLYVTVISIIFAPVGLGICGAALYHRYHYMVYAVGYFIVVVALNIVIPVSTNYLAENFTHYGTESMLVITVYRLAWGIAIPFIIEGWIARVGINWVYGIAALTTIGTWLFTFLILLVFGSRLRRWNLMRHLVSSEEGKRVFKK